MNDIDSDAVYRFWETADRVRNINESLFLTPEDIPRKLDLLNDYNPAHLFEQTINIARLKTRHPSRPGNKLIAETFYLMGLFENWGSGTLKIISDTMHAGKLSPEFFYEDGMFRLELYR